MQSFWVAEADTITGSFAKFRAVEFQAGKLVALCVASSELVADAPLCEAHIRRVFAQEMAWQLDQKILNGGGAGVPLGIRAELSKGGEQPSADLRRGCARYSPERATGSRIPADWGTN
jgi:HK97 family phage major capsid protein